jgi:hypothetical protein
MSDQLDDFDLDVRFHAQPSPAGSYGFAGENLTGAKCEAWWGVDAAQSVGAGQCPGIGPHTSTPGCPIPVQTSPQTCAHSCHPLDCIGPPQTEVHSCHPQDCIAPPPTEIQTCQHTCAPHETCPVNTCNPGCQTDTCPEDTCGCNTQTCDQHACGLTSDCVTVGPDCGDASGGEDTCDCSPTAPQPCDTGGGCDATEDCKTGANVGCKDE